MCEEWASSLAHQNPGGEVCEAYGQPMLSSGGMEQGGNGVQTAGKNCQEYSVNDSEVLSGICRRKFHEP